MQVTVDDGYAAEKQEWQKTEKKLLGRADEANEEMYRQHRITQQLKRGNVQQQRDIAELKEQLAIIRCETKLLGKRPAQMESEDEEQLSRAVAN